MITQFNWQKIYRSSWSKKKLQNLKWFKKLKIFTHFWNRKIISIQLNWNRFRLTMSDKVQKLISELIFKVNSRLVLAVTHLSLKVNEK